LERLLRPAQGRDESMAPLLNIAGHLANGAKHFEASRWDSAKRHSDRHGFLLAKGLLVSQLLARWIWAAPAPVDRAHGNGSSELRCAGAGRAADRA
jgi:hypothetical protein